MKTTLRTHSSISPTLRKKLAERLKGGDWDVEAKKLELGAGQEGDFTRLATAEFNVSRAAMLRSNAPSPEDRQALDSKEMKAHQRASKVRGVVDQTIQTQWEASMKFAYEGLYSLNPAYYGSGRHDAYGKMDLGDGVTAFDMGYTHLKGERSSFSPTGLLVIDTTPGQDGATAVWVKKHKATPKLLTNPQEFQRAFNCGPGPDRKQKVYTIETRS